MKKEEIIRLEAYADSLKIFHEYIKKAKAGEAGESLERSFMEIKAQIAQGAEINSTLFKNNVPKKEELFSLVNSVPTLVSISENPEQARSTENLWNKLLMQLQMVIGHLKSDTGNDRNKEGDKSEKKKGWFGML